MAEEDDIPFDAEEEYTVVHIQEDDDVKYHDKWTIITFVLALLTNLAADFSDFFGQMTRASSQHTRKRQQMSSFYEKLGIEKEDDA